MMDTGLKILTNDDFERLGKFIQSGYGIKMPDSKKTMLQARLQKRLRLMGLNSFHDYCNLVFTPEYNDEIINMIDAVTTNKTDFFRESVHFQYLVNNGLPEIIRSKNLQPGNRIKIWSAGCSTGEEPYTIAMVIDDFLQDHQDISYTILGTDLSTRVLEKARLAIYEEEKVAPVQMKFKKKYLLKSKDQNTKQVRIVPELRSKVTFEHLNFMDAKYPIKEQMDIIFCRNVIIYFDRPTQERIVNKLVDQLKPNGYLFIGHSETLFSLNIPVYQVAPTIYRKN